MSEHVRLEVADGVATVRLDRPPVNALDAAVQDALGAAARECAERDDVGAVVVWGGPKIFAAGADVAEMVDMDRAAMEARGGELQGAFTAVAEVPKPVVAAVEGYALGGGCELALCADLRIAGERARLGQPEILLGIIPGAGGTQRLARLVGPSRAKDLIFTGRMVEAAEALAMGLVDQVVPAGQAYDVALAWARRVAAGPGLALSAAKRCVDRGLDGSLEAGLELERAEFAALFGTEDQVTGMRSFLEHGPGKARFTGR